MLNPEQLERIEKKISQLPIHANIKNEMLDHYATDIENKMIVGSSFEKAFGEAFSQFPLEEVKSINTNYYMLNPIIMFKRIFPAACIVSIIAFMMYYYAPKKMEWTSPIQASEIIGIPSGFGYRTHPIYKTKKLHAGIDYTAPTGTPIESIEDGEIILVKRDKRGYGNHVKILHANGTISLYAHMHEIFVEENQMVSKQDTIGTVGATGTSTAPHLHLEIIEDGKKINPAKLDSNFVHHQKTTRKSINPYSIPTSQNQPAP